MTALLAACGGGPSSAADPYDYDVRVVQAYCSYGAVSRAQLDSCERNVSRKDVRLRDTNAARFAKGQIAECLEDSGPFCRDNAYP